MIMVFHSSAKRLPWLVGAALLLLAGGVLVALS